MWYFLSFVPCLKGAGELSTNKTHPNSKKSFSLKNSRYGSKGSVSRDFRNSLFFLQSNNFQILVLMKQSLFTIFHSFVRFFSLSILADCPFKNNHRPVIFFRVWLRGVGVTTATSTRKHSLKKLYLYTVFLSKHSLHHW